LEGTEVVRGGWRCEANDKRVAIWQIGGIIRPKDTGGLMNRGLLFLGWGFSAAVGITVFYWAGELAERYNARTTRLRERYPQVNPPPTREWRKQNTNIMTWMFRFAGAFLLLISILSIVAIMN
jgi:hypothetical protein